MGLCWSRTRYFSEMLMDEEAWSNWDRHEARKYYKVGRPLGKGAFSSVRLDPTCHARVTLSNDLQAGQAALSMSY